MKHWIVIIFMLLTPLTLRANDALTPAFKAYAARNFDDAINALEQLAKRSPDKDVLFHLARIQYRTGELSDAKATLETLNNAFPDYDDAYYLGGLVDLALINEVNIFKKVGMAKSALSQWEKAVALNPEHINARYAIFAFYASAPSIAGGDMDKAETLSTDLESRNPGFGAMAQALLLSKQDNTQATEAAFQRAIELLNRAGPHFTLAQFYLDTEQYERVPAQITQFHNKEKRWWDPDITAAYLIEARASAAMGKPIEAREQITLALSMKPNPQIKSMLEDKLESL